MELFEAIRREYQFGVGTIKGVARKLGIHRRMVREVRIPTKPISQSDLMPISAERSDAGLY